MKDLTKPRGWKSRLSAIVLSIAIALAFMPSLGVADQAKAYEGYWEIYCDDVNLAYGQSCKLKVELDYDESENEPPDIISYDWYKGQYDTDAEEYTFEATSTYTSTSPEYNVGKVYSEQVWKCVANIKDGEPQECICTINCDAGWEIEPEKEEYYAFKGDDVNLKVNTVNYTEDERVSGSVEIIKYDWYKIEYDEDDNVTETLMATTNEPSYTVRGVNNNDDWRCIAYAGDESDCSALFCIVTDDAWWINDENEDGSYYYNEGDTKSIIINPIFNIKYGEGVDKTKYKFSYEWYEGIETGNEDDPIEWKKIEGQNNKELAISGLKSNKEYMLKVYDQFGTRDSVNRYVRVLNKEAQKAMNVNNIIKALKEPAALSLLDKNAVMSAKAEYDALSTNQKNMLETSVVTKLNEAVSKIISLEANAQAEAEAKAKAEAEAKAKAEAEAKAKAEKKAIAKAKNLTVKGFKVKAATGKKATVTWKATKGAKGYQIMYSLNKKFKKAKKINIKKAKAKKAVIKKLKAKKNYFVKIRPYSVVKKANGKNVTVYGKWSKVKIVKAKIVN